MKEKGEEEEEGFGVVVKSLLMLMPTQTREDMIWYQWALDTTANGLEVSCFLNDCFLSRLYHHIFILHVCQSYIYMNFFNFFNFFMDCSFFYIFYETQYIYDLLHWKNVSTSWSIVIGKYKSFF